MKNFAVIFALGLAAIATPAMAQNVDSARMIERLRAADLNHDNVVSRQEFLTYRAGQFDRLDRNHDGYVTESDMPRFAARRSPAGMGPAELQAQFDVNHDGRVSRTEFVNGPTLAFDRVDANHDNLATQAEFEAALAAARSAAAQRTR